MGRDVEQLKLGDAITHLLEECRMVLPGVQALFGFQLIAVFNAGFAEKLSRAEQELHLLALALVAVSAALIMTPAALDRQTAPREASERFLRVASRLLLASMLPLMAGIGIDFYLITRIVLGDAGTAMAAAVALVAFLAICWFLFPSVYRRRYHRD
jgi:Flp pilus assembly protein TadB